MAKSAPPSEVFIPAAGQSFVTNAVPDVFDERDLEYRPRLEPLPASLDCRDEVRKHDFILTQEGNSCTGHAVATVVNTVLARHIRSQYEADHGRSAKARKKFTEMKLPMVSPYMLYALARRYDEFSGEEDIGSSLRGAFKGWFNHGVALSDRWPTIDDEQDLDDPDFLGHCRERPLGAFYRVNPYRLDDMQSALSELNAIAVSGAIHEGWLEPCPYTNPQNEKMMYVIERQKNPQSLGGHAFALVGYNEIGFLVQNSWGPLWGKDGFATLTYEDWLDSAYDAWVARPGVPQTPFYSGRTRVIFGPGGKLYNTPGPDLNRLARHVANLGNDGRLSQTGKFRSSPAQIDKMFTAAEEQHDQWQAVEPGLKRHFVFYVHGGMVSEDAALKMAQSQLNWWLNNRIYPIYFAWQTGPIETIINQLGDRLRGRLPVGGVGFDLIEQLDRLVEKLARDNFRWAWNQMKSNARLASEPVDGVDLNSLPWPPTSRVDQLNLPGGRLMVSRLKHYIEKHGAENVALHLVGHSAGSIFLAYLLDCLAEAGIQVDSLSFLAPGIRVDEFDQQVYPYLKPGGLVKRFSIFNLSEQRELDDACIAGDLPVYHKSLLYIVSRSLEPPSSYHPQQTFEVPILGMQKFFNQPLKDGSPETLAERIAAVGGRVIVSPSTAPENQTSNAAAHGALDDDSPTMTSVLLLALDLLAPSAENTFREHAALRPAVPVPVAAAPVAETAPAVITTPGMPEPSAMPVIAEVHAPGEAPVAEMAEMEEAIPVDFAVMAEPAPAEAAPRSVPPRKKRPSKKGRQKAPPVPSEQDLSPTEYSLAAFNWKRKE